MLGKLLLSHYARGNSSKIDLILESTLILIKLLNLTDYSVSLFVQSKLLLALKCLSQPFAL